MNKLRELRVAKRVTQFQLRVATGIHQAKISMIENGLIAPREEEKQRLAKALHVRPEEIWGQRQQELIQTRSKNLED